jgi:mono/diheme cytochrome c family protein
MRSNKGLRMKRCQRSELAVHLNRCENHAKQTAGQHRSSSRVAAVAVLLIAAFAASFSLAVHAGQARTVQQGVYSDAQAARGEQVYTLCQPCHGDSLGGGLGPPLTGEAFLSSRRDWPLSDLATKIQNTMPQNSPGSLTPQQTADVIAYILRVAKFPSGTADLSADQSVLAQIGWPTTAAAAAAPPATPGAQAFPAVGNMAQVMRGILFPSSNIIFNVQGQNPGAEKTPYASGTTAFSWVDWGAGIYPGWELVDFAAIAIAESAPLLMTPGRRCENGRPVPIERADWQQWTNELVEAGRAAYRASQSRNQEAVIAATDQLATACQNCHEVYRDKPGGTTTDPSNKAARCVP